MGKEATLEQFFRQAIAWSLGSFDAGSGQHLGSLSVTCLVRALVIYSSKKDILVITRETVTSVKC